MNIETKTEARIYVGTYEKYNNGSIFGKWLDLSDYSGSEEFCDACKDLHKDETDPEFMFQDFEGFPRRFYSESGGVEEIYEYLEMIEELDEDEKEAFESYVSNGSGDDVESFRESFQGIWDSEQAFSDNLMEELGYLQAMEKAGISQHYFDAAAFSYDLFMCDYWRDDNTGAVFSNH